jgi:hypothetical protein
MTATTPKTVRIECIVNPDVHLGDGRRLMGPVREGTKTVQHGDVAEVDEQTAKFLIKRGQVQETKRDVTVFPED